MMNTTAQDPRSGSVEVAGVRWLARMIDKARLDAAGVIDELDLEFPCPMDRGLLSELGIDAKTFQQIVVNADNDESIVTQMKAAGAKWPA